MLKCSNCSKEFKYESEKKRHEQSHTPQFECTECCKKFSFLSALRRHQKQHDRQGSVQCNECGHYFRDNTLLIRHIKYAHKGTYICSKCKAKFNSDLALKSHMKTHKPIGDRRYPCTFEGCHKSFNFLHHLKHHEFIHTDTRQYFCNLCGKGFVQAQHLKNHIKTHDNWLHCTVSGCHKKFKTELSRNRHLITHNIHESEISSESNCEDSKDNALSKMQENSNDHLQHKQSISKMVTEISLDNENTALEPNNNYNNIEVFNNCKTVLGKCIANENSPNSCLCAQINDASNFYDELLPNENFDTLPDERNHTKENTPIEGACEGCECSNTRTNSQNNSNSKEILQKVNDDMPTLEFRKDGAIKLKETCDISFDLKEETELSEIDKLFNNNFVPYNSCKAVLGKCIVSGSGTISENCLCAKMAMDDHQITQEIEEITPHPMN